jgi:hypothetical protein
MQGPRIRLVLSFHLTTRCYKLKSLKVEKHHCLQVILRAISQVDPPFHCLFSVTGLTKILPQIEEVEINVKRVVWISSALDLWRLTSWNQGTNHDSSESFGFVIPFSDND